MRLREGGGRLRKMGKLKKEKEKVKGGRKERGEMMGRCEGEVGMEWGGMELLRGGVSGGDGLTLDNPFFPFPFPFLSLN